MQYTGRKIMESGKGGAVSGSRLLIDVIIIITIAMTMRATNNMIVTTKFSAYASMDGPIMRPRLRLTEYSERIRSQFMDKRKLLW